MSSETMGMFCLLVLLDILCCLGEYGLDNKATNFAVALRLAANISTTTAAQRLR